MRIQRRMSRMAGPNRTPSITRPCQANRFFVMRKKLLF
jgi:hypothetical protein